METFLDLVGCVYVSIEQAVGFKGQMVMDVSFRQSDSSIGVIVKKIKKFN